MLQHARQLASSDRDQRVAHLSARALQPRPPVVAHVLALAISHVGLQLLAHPALDAFGLRSHGHLGYDGGGGRLGGGDVARTARANVAEERAVLAGVLHAV